MSWIFENLCNWGEGGSKKHSRDKRSWAEDLAHEQLRGWYCTVKCHNNEVHYFNRRDVLVGKVYQES
jgi:hypothetical protein